MRKYKHPTSFVHKLIDTGSDKVLVFYSGLGLEIKKQREAFIRRFALTHSVSYLAFDCTKRVLMQLQSQKDFSLFEQESIDIIRQNFPVQHYLFVGACFGGNMALRAANHFPDKTDAVLAISPFIEYQKPSFYDQLLKQTLLKIAFCKRHHFAQQQLQQLCIFAEIMKVAQSFIFPQEQKYKGPLAILHPQKDTTVPLENSVRMMQCLNRQNVWLEILPGETHGLKKDFHLKKPREVLQHLLSSEYAR